MDPHRPDLGPVVFRCDGTAEIGLGHVSRAVALAEALEEMGVHGEFLGRFEAGAADVIESGQLTHRPSASTAGARGDLSDTIRRITETRAAAVVIDSYGVDAAYLSALDHDAAPTLVIDDFGALARYDCAALLNFTVGASHVDYPPGRPVRLLGLDFFLARKALRRQRTRARHRTGDVRHVLVAVGGVDGRDLSALAVTALLDVSRELTVHVAVGRSYSRVTELEALVRGFAAGSRVMVKFGDGWKVVHVHKSPSWNAPFQPPQA